MAPVVSMVGPKTPHGKENTTSAEVNQNIQVFVRCRPLKSSEKKNVIEVVPERREIRVHENKTMTTDKYNTKTFTFDNTFGPETDQIDVYRSVVEPLIEQVVMGYNCTVFAYGQTGTGKTYTMEGERSTEDAHCSWENDPTCGIIPRALHQLFEALDVQNAEHTVRVSFLELYNEELYDLLSAIDDTTRLKIYEDATRKGSIIVGGLEEITVQTKAEIYEILKKGSSKRQTAATLMNACSSRSHTVFSVTVHIKESSLDGEDLVKIGKLNLVDLAGSENIGRSGAIDKRAREAGNINQSLLTLGRVITSLVDRTPHIPYRESKLTRLLQDSLGGRTKTSIIATISPHILDVEDTLSTLEYAQRAKKITNKPEINQRLSKKTLLREYTAEIERLRRDLAACREKNGIYINEENYRAMEVQIRSQSEEIEAKTGEIQALTDEIAKFSSLFEETKEELNTKCEQLKEKSKTLKITSNELKKTRIDLYDTEKDRKEQRHLVEIHSNSEKILTDQANKLLNVADQTTADVGKLHEKVERQRNVETTNKTSIELFEGKFIDDMLRLEDLVNITTNSYQDSMEEMHKLIDDKIQNVVQIVAKAQEKALSLYDSVNEHKTRMTSIHNKDRVVLEQSIQLKDSSNRNIASIAESFSSLVSKVDESHADIQEELQTINTTIAQQRSDIEELVMKQNEFIKNICQVYRDGLIGIRDDIHLIFDNQNKQYIKLKKEIETNECDRSQANELMNEKWNQMEQLFMNNVKLMNEMKAQQMKANTSMALSNSRLIEQFNEEPVVNLNNENKLNVKVNELVGLVNTKESSGLTTNQNIDELNTQNTQQMLNQINVLNDISIKSVNETKALINEKEQLLNKQIKDSILLNEDLIKASDKQLKAKDTEVKQSNQEIIGQLDEEKALIIDVDQNLNTITECVSDCVAEMVRTSTTMKASQVREIDSSAEDFKRFVKNELIQDIPTGTTPQKTEYSYPRDLKQTSPHEKVLERFRKILDPSDAINRSLPEETDSEFMSDSNISINSIGSIQSLSSNGSTNDENVKPFDRKQNLKKGGIQSKVNTGLKSETTYIKDKINSDNKGVNKTESNAKPVPLKAAQNN